MSAHRNYHKGLNRMSLVLFESVVVMADGLDIRLRAGGIHSMVTELKDSEERICRVRAALR